MIHRCKQMQRGEENESEKRRRERWPAWCSAFFVHFIYSHLNSFRASLVVQRLKRLPAMWETWVRSLGREDPLEKEMATHSSIFAWRIPWMEELGGLQSTGHKESDTTERLHFHFLNSFNS